MSDNAITLPQLAAELGALVADLNSAKRIGTELDVPEGARYIQISDTLVNIITEKIATYVRLTTEG